jgi:hypothetical protein
LEALRKNRNDVEVPIVGGASDQRLAREAELEAIRKVRSSVEVLAVSSNDDRSARQAELDAIRKARSGDSPAPVKSFSPAPIKSFSPAPVKSSPASAKSSTTDVVQATAATDSRAARDAELAAIRKARQDQEVQEEQEVKRPTVAPPVVPSSRPAPKLPTRQDSDDEKEDELKADEKRKEDERKADEKRKEDERKADDQRKEDERKAEERRKEEERKADEKRKEDERKVDKPSGLQAKALYDYDKDNAAVGEMAEISLKDGETITIINQDDEGWWKGKNSLGEVGLFPSSYVELIARSSIAAPRIATPPVQAVVAPVQVAPPQPARAAAVIFGIALYDYDAQESDEVSFKEGDGIGKIDKLTDEGWWKGTSFCMGLMFKEPI